MRQIKVSILKCLITAVVTVGKDTWENNAHRVCISGHTLELDGDLWSRLAFEASPVGLQNYS